ncbi:MAG TPA: hypothetical protein VHX90_00295 [Verrucomicrobiae bacterium]|nr:hypothetical protein [Verrucomicrobiae bacterium]
MSARGSTMFRPLMQALKHKYALTRISAINAELMTTSISVKAQEWLKAEG